MDCGTHLPHLTECGIPGIKHIPYGLHLCHFYRTRRDLIESLVHYFAAGLRNRERCLWVTAPPLPAAEAKAELAKVWPQVEGDLQRQALRILDFADWYKDAAGLKGTDVVQLWLDEEQKALAEGYNGLRITGNTSFLEAAGWTTFMEYEEAVTRLFAGRRIVALCSYDLHRCKPADVLDVMRSHHCALDRPDAAWQILGELSYTFRQRPQRHP